MRVHDSISSLNGPFSVELPLDHEGRLRVLKKLEVSKFGIYIIRFDAEIVRIGESSSGIIRIIKGLREPLRKILRGKDRKNYLAYHWRDLFSNASIHADYFCLPDGFQDNYLRRALEAEVTFQFRLARKAWPRCMSEMHFLERSRNDPRVVEWAKIILGYYGHCFADNI